MATDQSPASIYSPGLRPRGNAYGPQLAAGALQVPRSELGRPGWACPTFLICSSLSSSSRKKVRYMKDTSTSQLPPNCLCSSMVSLPPENACLLTCVSKRHTTLGCWRPAGAPGLEGEPVTASTRQILTRGRSPTKQTQ